MAKLLFFCTAIFFSFFLVIRRPVAQGHTYHNVLKIAPLDETAEEYARLYNYGMKVKLFADRKSYCKKYCFLVDMRMPSGKKRFFLYDLEKDSVTACGLVAHGSGSQTKTEALQFSNVPASYASSLGKYRVGEEYTGSFGLAFKLYGLDSSNNNAYARAVVLHAHPLIPAEEKFPAKICTSWGCPTVNPDFLLLLKKHINASGKPVLLWIFY